MFGAIAPRWPRTFTAIGFGAAAMYIVLLILSIEGTSIQAESLEQRSNSLIEALDQLEEEINQIDDGETNVDAAQLLLLRDQFEKYVAEKELLVSEIERLSNGLFSRLAGLNFEVAGESSRIVVGAFFLFMAYVFGQVGMASGRIITYWKANGIREIDRVGRIANLKNNLLVSELEQYHSNIDLLSGLVTISLAVLFGEILAMTRFGSIDIGIAAGLVLLCSSLYICYWVSRLLGRRLDAVIDIVEAKETAGNLSNTEASAASCSDNASKSKVGGSGREPGSATAAERADQCPTN
jgi:hypothetical protein